MSLMSNFLGNNLNSEMHSGEAAGYRYISGKGIIVNNDTFTITADIDASTIVFDGNQFKVSDTLYTPGPNILIETDISGNRVISAFNEFVAGDKVRFEDVVTDVSDIQGTLSSHDGRIVAIETNVPSYDQGLINLGIAEQDITTLQQDLGTSNGRITDIEDLLTEEGGLVDQVTTNTTDIGTIFTDISVIADIISDLADMDISMGTMDTRVGAIEIDLSGATTAITGLQGALAATDGNVLNISNALYGYIDESNENVEGFFDATNRKLNTASSDVQNIQVHINTLYSQIAALTGGSEVVTEDDLADIRQDISTLFTNNITLTNAVSAASAAAEDNVNAIAAMQATINGLSGANDAWISAVESDLRVAEAAILQNTNNISAADSTILANQTSIGSLQSQISMVSQNVLPTRHSETRSGSVVGITDSGSVDWLGLSISFDLMTTSDLNDIMLQA